MRKPGYHALLATVMLLSATSAHATSNFAVPEISPGSISAGLAALTGAVLILRSMRR